ncbi:hypothetical protein H0H92_009861 [Tricholoma furcatifolium]|nr:hypothetical protein H0H92_009861 [Tricholoma furcatifolium]
MSARRTQPRNRNASKRQDKGIFLVDEGPDTQALKATETISVTRHRLTASGNMGSSTNRMKIVRPESSSQPSSLPTSSPPPPQILWQEDPNDTFILDPAYIESATSELVTSKQPRLPYNPIKRWVNFRDQYMAELLRHEGRGDSTNTCCPFHERDNSHDNAKFLAQYRCIDCTSYKHLLCGACIYWTGTHFANATLKSLGLRIRLGHMDGSKCLNRRHRKKDDFIVIHVNGIHEVGVDFCECHQSQPYFIQLLRHRWYPASVDRPNTAATFAALNLFQKLSFESKASAFEFYSSLKRLTCNTGLARVPDRYREFMVMIREFRHLKMLKRSGRGHDPAGTAATKPGACAVLCPACPQPNINLPNGWRDSAPEDRYLYSLFIAIDANFRLKRKNVSSDSADPGLSEGWSYFVPEKKFKDFLRDFDKLIIQEVITAQLYIVCLLNFFLRRALVPIIML